MKNSPAPWTCFPNQYGRSDAEFCVYDANGNILTTDDEENEANAVLISSAPDMLFALEIAQEFLSGRVLEIIQEAIAKATGNEVK